MQTIDEVREHCRFVGKDIDGVDVTKFMFVAE